jgi:murein DD-endopeptidase MepM/ murein hydrolase activator NlpD
MEALEPQGLVLGVRRFIRAAVALIVSATLSLSPAFAAENKTDRAVELRAVAAKPASLPEQLATLIPGQSEVVAARVTAETVAAVKKSALLERKAAANRASRTMFRMTLPAYGRITAGFGSRGHWWNRHTGMDIRAHYGDRVRAIVKGVVIRSTYDRAYGRIVVVRGQGVDIWYAHMSKTYVKAGDKVYSGKTIGRVGNSGRTTGTHLHIEVRKNDFPTNPATFLWGKHRGQPGDTPQWARYRIATLADL